MKKINNLKIIYNIIYSLRILVILAFGIIIIPTKIYAQAGYNFNYDTFGGYGNNYSHGNSIPAPTYYPAPIYYSAPPTTIYSATPTVYSSDSTGNTTKTKTVVKATSKKSTLASKSTTNSNLAANVIYGSNSFLPSGLVQWILFAIFILIIIILIRKVFGGEKNYHATPMKVE